MNTFHLQRDNDESGVSGTGRVAEGAYWPEDGIAVLHWLVAGRTTGIYTITNGDSRDGLEKIIDIHGHDGKTKLVMD